MTRAVKLRKIADLYQSRFPESAQELREIAAAIEPKPLLSSNPTEAEIAIAFREVGKRRLQSITDYETLWEALTKIQLAQGKTYADEPDADSEVPVVQPTVGEAH